jgi:dihydrodipicolinate synthase/N-acetylneuraminate lyase
MGNTDRYPTVPSWVHDALCEGIVIPAHPLALTRSRKLDESRQRALTRYYHAAGAGGVAVGVHTTQFAIRDPKHGLHRAVLELAAETMAACDASTRRKTVRVAGICGPTSQALGEARLAREMDYHVGLLSLGALQKVSDAELIKHCRAVALEIPLMGFYLQPAAGGRVLSLNFWRRFVEIANVAAIKIAPFNRYQTFEVIRAVVEAGRAGDIALYTGNDDHIVLDLVTRHAVQTASGVVSMEIVGGLLGHWAFWTRSAVLLLETCKRARREGKIPARLLTLAAQITDANAAVFDAAHGFAGCISGIHEVLRRQGLLENTLCLDPAERLSPGQPKEIDRVRRAYPHMNDAEFVECGLARWLR